MIVDRKKVAVRRGIEWTIEIVKDGNRYQAEIRNEWGMVIYNSPWYDEAYSARGDAEDRINGYLSR